MELTNEQVIYLNNLYKTLVNYRTYILKKKYKDNKRITISDDDYFKYGIEYDIIENALSIVVNILKDNIESVGVDNNSRSILEAFSILELDKIGYITPLRKQIYRVMYAGVEYGNLSKEIEKEGESNCNYQIRKDDYNTLEDLFHELFHLPKDKKINEKIIHDPKGYLAESNKSGYIDFNSILEKQGIDINSGFDVDLQGFFSVLIHPKCVEIEEPRNTYIWKILDKVTEFLNTLEPIKNRKVLSVQKYLKRHKFSTRLIFQTQNVCENYITAYKEKYSGHPYFEYYMKQLKYLMIDMLVCECLNYKDMVATKYKSFCENTAMLVHFMKSLTPKENHYETTAFIIETKLKLNSKLHVSKINKTDYKILVDGFDNFYMNRYQLRNIHDFINNLRKNDLYFYSDKRTSLRNIVNKELAMIARDEIGLNEIMNTYDASIDLEHASGYLYNQTPDLGVILCYQALQHVYSLMTYLYNVTMKSWSKENLTSLERFDIKGHVQVMQGIFVKRLLDTYKKQMPRY